MPYHEMQQKLGLSNTAPEIVFPPRDLSATSMRTITAACDGGNGTIGLASLSIQFGPTSEGPWIEEEDMSSADIYDLAAGESASYRTQCADRWIQVVAQAATGPGGGGGLNIVEREGEHQQNIPQQGVCNLTLWIDAV